MLRRLQAVPGVRVAAMGTRLPLAYGGPSTEEFAIGGYDAAPNESVSADMVSVTPGFLSAIGIALKSGRDVMAGDDSTAPHVVIISESVAKRYFAGREPIGSTIVRSENGDRLRVIGVAGDVKYYDLRADAAPTIYVPFEQSRDYGWLAIGIRTAMEPSALASSVRSALNAAAPGVTVRWVMEMREMMGARLT
jgi:hypothetical protein